MENVLRFWKEIAIGLIIIVLCCTIGYYKSELLSVSLQLDKARAQNVLNELQKEALRSAILDQNEAVEKERINAVQRAEVLRVKSESIHAKYERERVRVRDLNGSQECDEMRKMIEGAV